jgi:hypothetical protein
MSAWWRALDAAPAVTPRERRAVLLVSLLVAATRFLAISKTLWDWDEALFALALRDYDVTAYHPQPPGFPLFIGAAKLIALVVGDPFRSLQAITVVASLFLFPAMWALARELRAPAFVAFASAALLVFAPNVWFYGGTALSDVPSLVLALVACTLVLRGCRSDRSLLMGAVVLGIAAGFRPQNLMIAAAPLLIVLVRRRRGAIVALLIVVAIVGASYGTAAALSGGWQPYRAALAKHEAYIRATDSFLAPGRPSLMRVADDFFLRPYRAPWINGLVAFLMAAGALAAMRARRAPHLAAMLALFAPFCLFAWLYLDFHSASRFSVGYAPVVAFLAAEGIARMRRIAGPVLAAAITLMVAWTLPALSIVRSTSSPPVAALRYIRETADPRTTIVCFDERLGPHAALLLPEYQRCAAASLPPALWVSRARVLFVREGLGDVSFTRAPVRLANLVRPRYFEAGVLPAQRIEFVSGWAEEEGNPVAPYRRIAGTRAVVRLPAALRARLLLHLSGETKPEIRLNGRLIATSADFAMEVDAGAINELSIDVPHGSGRLDRLEWAPVTEL